MFILQLEDVINLAGSLDSRRVVTTYISCYKVDTDYPKSRNFMSVINSVLNRSMLISISKDHLSVGGITKLH